LGDGESQRDLALMAHELTHTVQQGASPSMEGATSPTASAVIQRNGIPFVDLPTAEEVQEGAEDAWDWGTGRAEEVVDWGADRAEDVVDWGADRAEDVVDWGADRAEDVVDWGADRARDVVETGERAVRGAVDRARDVAEGVQDAAGDAVDWSADRARDVVEGVRDAAGDAVDWGTDRARDVVEGVRDAAGDAVEWAGGVAGEVWDAARSLAAALGGALSRFGTRLVITVPPFSPCPALPLRATLPPAHLRIPLLAGPLRVSSDMTVVGDVSVTAAFIPEMLIQLGPCRVRGLRITVDPFGANWKAAGAVSITQALSVSAWSGRGGRARGTARINLPGVPLLRLTLPAVGIELGVASQLRATAAGTTDLAIGASGRGPFPFLQAGIHLTRTLGVGLDAGVGGYGIIDVMGIQLCRFHEPLVRHSLEAAVRLAAHGHVRLTPYGASAGLTLQRARLVPFGSLPLAFGRQVLVDDCARLRTICRVLHALGWMPAQSGGTWGGHPTPHWPLGPLAVLPRDPSQLDPSFAAGSLCRGACGPDCQTCSNPRHRLVCAPRAVPGGGMGHDLWIYPDFTECGTHQGCRDHDACYDHCAQGGSGWGPGLCARLCDMECACTFPPAKCVGWVAGATPHDGRMVFSGRPYLVGSSPAPCPHLPAGGGGGGGGAPGGG
jgi:hypothetical protein